MGKSDAFEEEKKEFITSLSKDTQLKSDSISWIQRASRHKYSYLFNWMGRPIIQFPQDMIAMQEIIWETKPDLIIETGIAHGGSLIFHSSILELIGGNAEVLGIDVDIRRENRAEIEKHPMFKRITMIEGSSTNEEIVKKVYDFAKEKKRIVVILDSLHTHDHVLKELELYSPLIKKDSYLIVLDTVIEDMPADFFPDRPWSQGNNPKTAVWEFLKHNNRFVVDKQIEEKLMITVAPDGYLKCVED